MKTALQSVELDIDFNGCKLSSSDLKKLLEVARNARNTSHSPYSKFKVGCAVMTVDGKIFPGTNVENASYGLTICGERSALCSAVSNGHKKFVAMMCTTSAPGLDFTPSCGACRQFMAEFGDYLLLIGNNENDQIYITTTMELLPAGFCSDHF